MLLTKNTINILKNFSKINGSIIIEGGNKIRTKAVSDDLYAEAEVDCAFPRNFAIYDLNEFLRGIQMFDSPQLIFDDDHEYVLISEDSDAGETPTAKYHFSDLQIIENVINLPDGSPVMRNSKVEFNLDYENIKKLKDACLVYGLNEISIVGVNGDIELQVSNSKNQQSHTFYIKLSDSNIINVDCDFHVIIDSSKMQFLDYSYVVKLNDIGAMFESTDGKLLYMVCHEASSEFDN
jgi:hypothetical protein